MYKKVFVIFIIVILILVILLFINRRGTKLNEIVFIGKVVDVLDEKVLIVDYSVKKYKKLNIEILEIDGTDVKNKIMTIFYIEINPFFKELLDTNIFDDRKYIDSVSYKHEDGFYYIDEPHYELFNILTEEEYLIRN